MRGFFPIIRAFTNTKPSFHTRIASNLVYNRLRMCTAISQLRISNLFGPFEYLHLQDVIQDDEESLLVLKNIPEISVHVKK
ncbi:hypothetical protein pb186bvf_000367 [Paramecium bursaria]